MTDKIDTRGMSDGEIYEAVSRRANPEAHARIDALMTRILQPAPDVGECFECSLIGRMACSEHGTTEPERGFQ